MSAFINRLPRIETGLGVASGVVALVAFVYLGIALVGGHEVCYGTDVTKLVCQPLASSAVVRVVYVLVLMFLLYAAGVVGAWFHVRAKEPSARSASLGLLWMAAIFLLGVVTTGLQGPGFFLLPSMILLILAAVAGLVYQCRDLNALIKSLTA